MNKVKARKMHRLSTFAFVNLHCVFVRSRMCVCVRACVCVCVFSMEIICSTGI